MNAALQKRRERTGSCVDEFGVRAIDRSGQKYGRLTYINPVGKKSTGGDGKRLLWLTICECGNNHVTMWKKSMSCGCLVRDIAKARKGSKEWARICAEQNELKRQRALEAAARNKIPPFDRLTICTRKAATYRELCPHFIECQDERVFGKKKVSDRYAASCGNCYEVPNDDVHLNNYQRLFCAVL